jgi:hypothetical protein
MFDKAIYVSSFLVAAGFMVLLSSCAVTTRSTEGTSETFQNTTDATSELTSSTSPRDEEKKPEAQNVKMFAAVNLDRLKGDMARGNGEHLTAFAHLLGIKETHQSEFFAFTKQNYATLFSSEPTTSEDMVARLNTELNAYPVWRQ